jgi:hypothetical protein
MGYAKATIKLSNARTPGEGECVEVEASVDPGSMLLCISPELASKLDLEAIATRHITGPDGRSHECPYVGPLRVQFEDRASFAGALVLGSGVWLGAIQMADMDLSIDPAAGRVTVNPVVSRMASSRS